MNQPTPPSAFRTRAADVASDLHTIRRFLEQLVAWVATPRSTTFLWSGHRATLTVDRGQVFAAGNTLTGDSTLALQGGTDGARATLVVKQDATGGHELTLSVPGWTIIRDDGDSDDFPAAAADAVTVYTLEFLTLCGVPTLYVTKQLAA